MNKFLTAALLLTMIVTLGSGCWDAQNISNYAFVNAIGLDAVSNTNNTTKYKISFEIIRTSGYKQLSFRPPSIIETVEAENLQKAIEQMRTKISQPLNLTYLQLIIFGEKLAHQNIQDLLNFFRNNKDVTLLLPVLFIQDAEAEAFLQVKNNIEKNHTRESIESYQLETPYPLARTNNLFSFNNNLKKTNGRDIGSRILLSKQPTGIIFSGGAIFNDWKLSGWLNDNEIQAANWIIGTTKAPFIVVGKMKRGIYTYQVDQKSVRIISKKKNGQLQLLVELSTNGTISEEQKRYLDLTKLKNIQKLEKLFAATIAAQISSAIKKAQQEYQIDYLGFGLALQQKDPKSFKKLNWEKVFPSIPISVKVKSKIVRFGLIEYSS